MKLKSLFNFLIRLLKVDAKHGGQTKASVKILFPLLSTQVFQDIACSVAVLNAADCLPDLEKY